jgi:hypothetical protein
MIAEIHIGLQFPFGAFTLSVGAAIWRKPPRGNWLSPQQVAMRPARLTPTMSGRFSASVLSLPGAQHNIPNFALALQIGGRTGRTPRAALR